jgi:hypothetical protein
MTHMPFPSNENDFASSSLANASVQAPWKRANPSEPPPIMFQLQFCDGKVISYAYCDLRETRLRGVQPAECIFHVAVW